MKFVARAFINVLTLASAAASAAAPTEQLCLQFLLDEIVSIPTEARLGYLEERKLMRSRSYANGARWFHPDSHALETYVNQVAPDTAEIILDSGHMGIRVGKKIYHMLADGIAVHDFTQWVGESLRRKHYVLGLGLQLHSHELKAIENFFLEAQGQKALYATYSNNCSQNVCRALQAAQVHSAKPVEALVPALAALALSKNAKLKYRVSYNSFSEIDPEMYLNRSWRRELAPRLMMLGIVGMSGTALVVPHVLGAKEEKARRQTIKRTLATPLKDCTPSQLARDLQRLAKDQIEAAGPGFPEAFMSFLARNRVAMEPFLITAGVSEEDLRSKSFPRS